MNVKALQRVNCHSGQTLQQHSAKTPLLCSATPVDLLSLQQKCHLSRHSALGAPTYKFARSFRIILFQRTVEDGEEARRLVWWRRWEKVKLGKVNLEKVKEEVGEI